MRDETRRRLIIEAAEEWADESDYQITFIGSEENRHLYADAIVGVVSEPRPAIIYLRSKVIEALTEAGDGDWESASEFFEYNTVRGLAYVKPEDGPPIIVDDLVF